jgi:hypothetical protein
VTSTSSRAAAPTVGGYRLLGLIGEGGMGMVHLAEDRDGRRAALKVLRPNVVGDEESRRRLAQEVDSLRHVHSEHVAEILDADPWGEVPYVVTRFVSGESLHARVAQSGPLSGEELEHAARGLLLAVRDVHAAQVLHRDIKPTNVVMEGPSPILIDFGLARLAEDPRLTATGWLMGTPGYLAPEVLFGGSASTATDVHGWAATLVYAATGHSPYGRGHTMAVLDRTRHGNLDLAGLPDRLRPLLTAALATEPRRRPTVPQALAALGVTDSSDIAAPPSTRPYTVLAPNQPSGTPAIAAYPLPARLTGWARVRRLLSLVALAGVVTACFGTAPYLTGAAVAVGVLLSRGLSHGRQATSFRRSVRGRKWFDGPAALLSYPWHLVRGSLGGLVLVLVSAVPAAAVSVGSVVGGARPGQALLVGGAVLAAATWGGPGSARVREPVGGMLTRLARHPALWFLVVTALAVGGVAAWWAGAQDGVLWAPASGAPWRELRGLAEDLGLAATAL